MAATSLVTDLAAGAGSAPLGIAVRVGALLLALVIGTLTYWLALRLAIAGQVPGRQLWTGALLGALGWQILQAVGGYYITHQLRHASALYGAFGLVLGLIAWLYLQARVTLYAVAVDVVRSRRLWPRSLFPPPATAGDRRAWDAAMAAQDRSPTEAEAVPESRPPVDADPVPTSRPPAA
ncbi:YhjD/YihY/BrkB family envelope integrity protein [Catenulispora yoronensis]